MAAAIWRHVHGPAMITPALATLIVAALIAVVALVFALASAVERRR